MGVDTKRVMDDWSRADSRIQDIILGPRTPACESSVKADTSVQSRAASPSFRNFNTALRK
jgi:hypothetical protein